MIRGRALRPLCLILVSLLLLAVPSGLRPAGAMTIKEREALDLGAYRVTHPGASFFDIAARKAAVRASSHPIIRAEIAKLRRDLGCQEFMDLPIIKGSLVVPMKYRNPEGWDIAAKPFLTFEDAVSRLAASQFVASDSVHGECLVKLLDHWAKEGAFLDLNFTRVGLQTWFQTEGSLLAAALAYSIVRNDVAGMDEEKRSIETWLVAAARHHLSRKGAPDGSCCNNHFYRRSAYAAMIGVLVGDDRLFRLGVSAIYSALSEATPEGALLREMKRANLAALYQNYATMYLVFIAQIAKMQGYDLFAVEVNGRRLDDVVGMAIRVLKDPGAASGPSGVPVQSGQFATRRLYLSWLELLPGMSAHAEEAGQILATHRPLYNRSLGGFMTLYFAPY
jgi:poly(beta-D-mannuronate) lyase